MRFLKTLPGLACCGAGIYILMLNRDEHILDGAIYCLLCCALGVVLTAIIFKPKQPA